MRDTSPVNAIAKIYEILNDLVNEGVLADVNANLIGFDAQRIDGIPEYPMAITHPAVLSANRADDFKSNQRVHNQVITILFKNDQDTSSLYITEVLMKIIDAFDERISLDGEATEVEPSTSATYEIEGAHGKVAVDILLSIKTIKVLSFLGQ